MMFACRARENERRIRAQQLLDRGDVPNDDGVNRGFELRDGRTRVLHRLGEYGELIPALEVMFPRDNRAGVAFGVVRSEAAPPGRLHRTVAQQVAVSRKKGIERRDVAIDERLLRARPDARRAVAGDRFDVLRELRPALESVPAGDDEVRSGETEVHAA